MIEIWHENDHTQSHLNVRYRARAQETQTPHQRH